MLVLCARSEIEGIEPASAPTFKPCDSNGSRAVSFPLTKNRAKSQIASAVLCFDNGNHNPRARLGKGASAMMIQFIRKASFTAIDSEFQLCEIVSTQEFPLGDNSAHVPQHFLHTADAEPVNRIRDGAIRNRPHGQLVKSNDLVAHGAWNQPNQMRLAGRARLGRRTGGA